MEIKLPLYDLLNRFLIGLVFNGMGMFFLRAEALGAEQRALWGGRKRPGTIGK